MCVCVCVREREEEVCEWAGSEEKRMDAGEASFHGEPTAAIANSHTISRWSLSHLLTSFGNRTLPQHQVLVLQVAN